MAQFNLDSYEFVADRIDRFYKDHPEGRIITSIVSPIPEAKEWVIFQAAIFDGLVQLSTGYAMEIFGVGPVNRTSHVENCETSAIGRGLANIGLSGTLRPSREEMENVNRQTATDQERIIEGRRVITQLIEDNPWLSYDFRVAIVDESDSAKTIEEVTAAYNRLKKEVKAEQNREMKAGQKDAVKRAVDGIKE